MKNIIFIGDSFCSSMDPAHFKEMTKEWGQWAIETGTAHPSYVANEFGAKLSNFGYSGKSWWYSYEKFNKVKDYILSEHTIAIIFFHTNAYRINSSNPILSNSFTSDNTECQNAYKAWWNYIYDENFQTWSQQNYFSELNELYSGIKTIHFNCFPESVPYCNLLPGMVYRTSLKDISNSESYVNWIDDLRANHFNEANNLAMARIIIDSINNYTPGIYDIDISKFDLVPEKVKINTDFGTESKVYHTVNGIPTSNVIHTSNIIHTTTKEKNYETIMKEKGFFK